jgi:TRAP-type C4-dicarboxylate transport system substrate-binding protein
VGKPAAGSARRILPIARGYAAENIRIVQEREKSGLEVMQKGGAKISTLPEEERLRWAKAMPNLAKTWVEAAEKRGQPGKAIMEEYMAAMRAAGAKPARDWDKGL